MRILITGAAGFIGSSLAEVMVEQGLDVIGIDNFDPFYPRAIKEQNLSKLLTFSNFSFVEADITKEEDLRALSPVDGVIHLAAKAGVRPSIDDPAAYAKTNVLGTVHVLEWMRSHGCKKLVFASSSSVYGNNEKIPFAEADNVDFPISPYAATKKSCELFTHTYHQLYQFDVINLRFFTVYGPRQRPDLAIHKFVNKLHASEPIQQFGDGKTGRDYTYIDDIVQGIEAAFNHLNEHSGVYETINLGNNKPVLLTDLINTIETAAGKQFDIEVKPMQPGDVNHTFADISKAQRLLNYAPKTSFSAGIEKFIAWKKGQA